MVIDIISIVNFKLMKEGRRRGGKVNCSSFDRINVVVPEIKKQTETLIIQMEEHPHKPQT